MGVVGLIGRLENLNQEYGRIQAAKASIAGKIQAARRELVSEMRSLRCERIYHGGFTYSVTGNDLHTVPCATAEQLDAKSEESDLSEAIEDVFGPFAVPPVAEAALDFRIALPEDAPDGTIPIGANARDDYQPDASEYRQAVS